MKKDFLLVLFLAVILISCASEEMNKRARWSPKKSCYWEGLLMPEILVPRDFQIFHEVITEELKIGVYKPFSIILEEGNEYFFSAKVLPGDELIRLYLLKGEDNEIKEKIIKGVFLRKNVSNSPQIIFSPEKTGEYQIILQTHLSDCTDKVLVALAVAKRIKTIDDK